jgi:hypothetical protein
MKFDHHRVRIKMQNASYALERLRQRTGERSAADKIRYYFGRESMMWDFSLFSYGKMKKYFRAAARMEAGSGRDYYPVVLVGHSKEFMFGKSIERFIRYARKRGAGFATVAETLDRLAGRGGRSGRADGPRRENG